MASTISLNVTSTDATDPDGFRFTEEPTDVNVYVDPNQKFRKCMLALRILLHVPRFQPVFGGDRGVVVVLNTVFCSPSINSFELVGNYTVQNIHSEKYTLYTLFKDSMDSLLCSVQKCSQLVYSNVLYIINSVLYDGKLKVHKLELSHTDQSLFLYMFSATVLYLAHVLYGLSDFHFSDFSDFGDPNFSDFSDPNCSDEMQDDLNNLYQLYQNNIGLDKDDIVRKLYLLLFYKFQLIMNAKEGGVFISEYIE